MVRVPSDPQAAGEVVVAHSSGKPQDSPREPLLHLPRPGKRRQGDTHNVGRRDTPWDKMGRNVGQDFFACLALGNPGTRTQYGTKRDTTWDVMWDKNSSPASPREMPDGTWDEMERKKRKR